MEEKRFSIWMRRIVLAVFAVGVGSLFIATWVFSSTLERDYLSPTEPEPEFDLEIATVGSGRVVLTRTDLTEQDGIWGLKGDDAYGQVSAIIELREDVVERGFREIEGEFRPGDRAAFDQAAYVGTPLSAHGIGFEVVPVAGDLGVYPAWRVDAERDTWIIVVHGEGGGREQSLRMIPALRDAGYPVLAITYRNDPGTPASLDGRYGWGREEWRDLEDAATYAKREGADELVVFGFAMGGEIVSMFLHQSELVTDVVAVVLDSPVLDLEAVVDTEATERGIPSFLAAASKQLATLRFDIDWRELDQVERASEFDVAVLLMHGELDGTAPVGSSDAFAAARPDIVTYERFAGAHHLYLWNTDPIRYETALIDFLGEVTAPLE